MVSSFPLMTEYNALKELSAFLHNKTEKIHILDAPEL
jgi:hypothetical protein